MQSIKDSVFYSEVLEELNYGFGTFYLFDGFVVSEIDEGVNFTWEHACIVIEDISTYYNSSGHDIVYISNRVNHYSVRPVNWLKFTMYTFKLKGYGIIVNTSAERKSAQLESVFIPAKFKTFHDLFQAIQWAAELNDSNLKIKNKDHL